MKKNAIPKIVPMEPGEEAIRECAYLLYVESGRIPGRDLENWFEARRRLGAKLITRAAHSRHRGAEPEKTAHKPAAG